MPESLERVILLPHSLQPHLDWWLNEQCTSGPTVASPSTRSSKVYRRLKLRLGRTLGDSTTTGVWSITESRLYINFLEFKSSLPGPQEFRASLQGPDCIDNNGQHNCCLLHQQGRYEIRLSLCPLETSALVSLQRNSSEVSAHSRSLECNSKQAVQTQPSDQTEWSLSQQVLNLWCSRWARPHVELFATRFSHKLPKFVSPVPDPTAWAVDVGESGCLHLPFSLPARPHNLQDDGSRLSQDDSYCSRVVPHALVLGPGQFYRFRSLSGSLRLSLFCPRSNIRILIMLLIILPQIHLCLNLLFAKNCKTWMILIAPGWSHMPWFWDLVSSIGPDPFQDPCICHCFVPGRTLGY